MNSESTIITSSGVAASIPGLGYVRAGRQRPVGCLWNDEGNVVDAVRGININWGLCHSGC